MSARPIPSLEQRIQRLERLNRGLIAALTAVGGLLLLAFSRPASPSQPPPSVADLLQARRIQVLDAQGRIRIDLKHDTAATGLFVHDDLGTVRLGAAHFANGGGGFALHGPGLKGSAVLYLKEQASLTFYDPSGSSVYRVTGKP